MARENQATMVRSSGFRGVKSRVLGTFSSDQGMSSASRRPKPIPLGGR
jgi:hypothetical protein